MQCLRRSGLTLVGLLATALVLAVWSAQAHALLPETIDLRAGEEDVLVYGATADDWLTVDGAIAVGDINGDGEGDLILGAPFADGPAGARDLGGEAYIYYGGATLAGTRDVAGIAGAAPDVIIYGASADDRLTSGGALAVGDVNGDSVDDLILGAWSAAGPGDARATAGEAYIIYGSGSLPSTIDLASGSEDVTIYGATAGDKLTEEGGIVVADVTGDSVDDIILGSFEAAGPGDARAGAGETYIIFGSGSLPASIDLASSGEDVTVYGATAGDLLTLYCSIVIGDVNNDDIGDLILGAQAGDGPGDGRPGAGEVYIIYGSGSLPAVIDLANGDEDVTVYGASDDDGLPKDGSVIVGDVNGDGVDDVILGTESADGPSDERIGCGEAYIIYGSGSLPAVIDLANGDEDVTIYGAARRDGITRDGAIAVGDVNGDGFEDTILGAELADGPGDAREWAGEAYVILGSGSLPAVIDLASHSEDVRIYGADENDYLTGLGAIAVGDLTGDGLDEIILGARQADGPIELRHECGEAYIIYGSNSLPATIDLAGRHEDVTIFGASDSDWLTRWSTIALGDTNGDGVNDLILGAISGDGPGNARSGAGEAYVIFGWLDTDGDGMPDDWEIDNGLDPNDDGSVNPDNGPDGDPDGDGHSNLDEYENGTDPQDPESFPVPVAGTWALVVVGLALVASAGSVLRRRKRSA